jgi:FkbM family methyltransferase
VRGLKYRLRRRYWDVLRRCLPAEITERIGGVKLRYRPRSDIGKHIYFLGSFEQAELALIARILGGRPPGPLTIFDVGANIGVHSITLCSLLAQARVIAFEPAADTRRLLERNIRGNGLADRVIVEPYALSNALGNAEFFEMDDDAFSSLKDTGRKGLLRRSSVQLETLDHYVGSRAIRSLDLVKIDVEGFETEVIEGSLATLAAMRPDLLVEIYQGSNSNPDPARTIALLTGAGYRAWVVENGGLQPFVRHQDRLCNYYFSVRDVAAELARPSGPR